MTSPVKRQYRSPARERAAAQTRATIREAAARLFVEQGYALTTMRHVADEAEVSERTVYLVFPTKLDLFGEVIGVAMAGDDRPIPIAQRPEFREALDEQDGARALELSVDGAAALLERAGAVIMAGYESAGADEGLRAAARGGEAARAQDLRMVAQALATHGALRPELSVDEATDILLALASPQVHQMLRRDRGRSLGEYKRVIRIALQSALLAGHHDGNAVDPTSRTE